MVVESFKMKICVVGPPNSGKSSLCNFLADFAETAGTTYKPTVGVRILEVERKIQVEVKKQSGKTKEVTVAAELWDCSGNKKFENCWPAFVKEMHGVIFVFTPEDKNHERELEDWHTKFVVETNLKESQCLLMAHHKDGASQKGLKIKLGKAFTKIELVHTTLDAEVEHIREDLDRFLASVYSVCAENREKEELSILNNP